MLIDGDLLAMKFLRLSLAVLFTAGLAACSKTPPPAEPVRSVKLMAVAPSALSAQEAYAGEVKARVESAMGFRVGGKVLRRHVEVGQRVLAGQLLVELDPADLRLAAEAAQAQVAAAQTQRDLAAADLKRYQDLRDKGFVSGAEIERRSATLNAAEASLRQALAQAGVQGNQASYAQLRAGAAGVVVSVAAEPGQVVAAGAPVVKVAQDGPRDVVFAVPESRVASVRTGQAVEVSILAAGPEAFPATVREVAASADAASRTYQIRVALAPEVAAPLGATANVSFAASGNQVQAIRLPSAALAKVGQDTVVWVFDAAASTVQPRPVKVQAADGNQVVVTDGIQVGEEIVAAGVHVLSPGQKVVRFDGSRAQAESLGAQAAR